jgi:hypothetical protein
MKNNTSGLDWDINTRRKGLTSNHTETCSVTLHRQETDRSRLHYTEKATAMLDPLP